MTHIEPADIAVIRQQGDLKEFLKQAVQAAAAECVRRKNLINRYPDLVARLHEIPGQRGWNGYIAPATWGHRDLPNDSPIRVQLLALVAEAEERASRDSRFGG